MRFGGVARTIEHVEAIGSLGLDFAEVRLSALSEPIEDVHPVLTGCPELGLTLDIGHVQLLTDRNRSFDYLQQLPHRIRHVHAHDNRGGSRVEDDLHLPIGEGGSIDFVPIVSALKKTRYDDTITLEVPHKYLKASVQKIGRFVNSIP